MHIIIQIFAGWLRTNSKSAGLLMHKTNKAVLLNNFFFGCFNRQYPALCASTAPALHILDNIDPTNFPTDLLAMLH